MTRSIAVLMYCLVTVLPKICLSQNKDTVGGNLLKRASYEDGVRDYKNAILDYSRFIEIHPNDAWWWMMRGEDKFKLNDTTGALFDLNKAIQIDSDFSYGYFQRGYVKSKIGDRVGSDWDFHKSEDLQHPFFDQARDEFRKGNYKSALKDFLISLSIHPEDADIYFELAITEHILNDNFNSEIYFKRGVDFYNLTKAK